jgi:hypothetical protein
MSFGLSSLPPQIKGFAGRSTAFNNFSQDKSYMVLPLPVFAFHGAAYQKCHVVRHDMLASPNPKRLRSPTRLAELACTAFSPL